MTNSADRDIIFSANARMSTSNRILLCTENLCTVKRGESMGGEYGSERRTESEGK